MKPAAQLFERHRRHLAECEASGAAPLDYLQYRNRERLRAWRNKLALLREDPWNTPRPKPS